MGLPQTVLLTVRDFFDMPEDGNRYEIIEGRLLVTPPPVPRHQEILGRLALKVWAWVVAQGLGKWYQSPCGVVLDDGTAVQPDAFFISKDRVAKLVQEKAIFGAPDLVIEVLSPGTSKRDRTVKLQLYAMHGVREYWILDPEAECAFVHVLGADGFGDAETVSGEQILPSRVLPGVPVEIRELFED